QIEVTLRHNSNQIKIDSFSFADGRLFSTGFSNNVLINSDSTIVSLFTMASVDTPIPAGSGLLGKLYLSYSQTISPQVVMVDSTTWIVPPLILHSTSFHAPGATFKPQFIPGYLDIRATPQSLDSVWVAKIEAKPGDQVAVDVYAFNERNLSEIALALSYGTANLALDSVSFVGTRSVNAPTKTVQTQPDFQTLYATMEFSPAAPLAPGSGPVARLHFTIAPETPEGTIVVDSTTVGINYKTRFWLTAADGSIDFVPLFYSGSIKVTTQTDVKDITDPGNLPTEYHLAQNYPNPFNPTTTIELSLPRSGHVEVEVFNILGRRVSRLIDRELPAGTHRTIFDGRGDDGSALATGVYFYRITSGDFRDSKKMLLVK
ncbi:MAG: T9SS type A sorting domain-containing protein, partial [candidate division Zixibacteria bacterium]|nr:T9SS type A sorting domain-containing protein [candidate division Zixibacteria bacterium]